MSKNYEKLAVVKNNIKTLQYNYNKLTEGDTNENTLMVRKHLVKSISTKRLE